MDAHLGSESSVERFRAAVVKACATEVDLASSSTSDDDEQVNHTFLVVSYDRKVVGQTGSGHFSPVAAYDEASDTALILDTARFKYGPHWIPLQLLFDALQPTDPDTSKSRGFVLLSYDHDDHHTRLPLSMLFRSHKAQDPLRRRYKVFLTEWVHDNKPPPSLNDVIKFWTKDGTDVGFIWDLLQPQLVPVDNKDAHIVENICALVKNFLSDEPGIEESLLIPKNDCVDRKCEIDTSRRISISPAETMFIVYLSSLEPEVRQGIVLKGAGTDSFSDTARQQVLCEAELVQFAIDSSDHDSIG